ncbi:MAG: N-6 DNA methylase, partial [Candidatus Moranbacteria bacterium]|nr:N-6 DNA methylase [Candidatus Moranbacteria bacterium]
MANIFKDKLIKEKLENYKILDFKKKLAIVKRWQKAYKSESLQTQSESQCEQAFNKDFFIDILGYKDFPDDPRSIIPKSKIKGTGQKPDAILGVFSKNKEKISAVVEIKDANTPLDKSQKREGNLSPVQQAFKYKTSYKECPFVIATNFNEIRILKDNQLDYESFTLKSLIDEKNDYYNFKKFYYLLNKENFTALKGKTKTEELLSEIKIEQEKVSKEFYKKYKELRGKLIKNIAKNNQEARKKDKFYSITIQKAQKIIDRIVFICFCEDRELLPENLLQKVIKSSENSFSGLWGELKGLFLKIDKGDKALLEIKDGYNGELFKQDQILDNLIIDDEVLKQLVELGKYDFSEEGGDLDVEILGHIFEQSISDIEELKTITKIEEIDKKQSKRKKDGVFYTPDYIVDYIVKNSLGKYLEEKENEIKKENKLKEDILDKNYKKRALNAYSEYQKVLQNVKVLDPACGSGAFLVKVFDYLLAENKRVNEILKDLQGGTTNIFSQESYVKHLLKNNIYGVDINEESVEITKLSLWLKTVKKGEKLTVLKDN